MLAQQHSLDQASQKLSPTGKRVIAHRGLCSLFPQNTIEAIIAAIYCSDLVEFDVHLTKDEEVVVFHDRYLSRTTDICSHDQFSYRLKEQIIDDYQEKKTDWWIREFTLQELRKLRVFQPVKYRPTFPQMNFRISTLQEIIQQSLKIKNKEIHKNKLKYGLLIEIKEQIAASLTQRDAILCRKVVELLKKYGLDTLKGCQQKNLPIVIQSFNIPLLSCIDGCENPVVQLYDQDQSITEEFLLSKKTKNVQGIGISQKSLLDSEGKPSKRVGQICKKLNYELFYWTIRDDDLNSKPFGCQNYHQVYLKLEQLGVTGFITEFPDKCRGILELETVMYAKGNAETETNNQAKQLQKGRKISQCQSMDSSTQDHGQKIWTI